MNPFPLIMSFPRKRESHFLSMDPGFRGDDKRGMFHEMTNTLTPRQFQNTLLKWFDQFGRHDLPWQADKTPYRVWVSEIMLQQTQVSTVIPYYENFMQRFPTVQDLAHAPDEAVMHAWAGLGYYSRARNLHRSAKLIVTELASQFPSSQDGLMQLPGVGQSTAGAIAAIALGKQAAILDGNVKRVLARLFAIDKPVKDKATIEELWDIAIQYTPKKRVGDYTQAIMDLGATLCTRSKPKCNVCPFSPSCLAYKQGRQNELPLKTKAKTIPTRRATFFLLRHEKDVLLIKRPAKGIWGGLWCLPSIDGHASENDLMHLLGKRRSFEKLKSFKHTFSHYHLQMLPVLVDLKSTKRLPTFVADHEQIWYNADTADTVGLPKPIHTILSKL